MSNPALFAGLIVLAVLVVLALAPVVFVRAPRVEGRYHRNLGR